MQDRTPAPKAEVCLVRATLADAENLHRITEAANRRNLHDLLEGAR